MACDIGVQPFRLFLGTLILPCVGAGGAALHQRDAVQRVDRHVGGEIHGLLDAHKILVQRALRVFPDQAHHLHRAALRLGLDRRPARGKHGKHGDKNRGERDRRDLKADRIHLHLAQSSRMDISRYMFLTEPFQEACMPSSRSEIT